MSRINFIRWLIDFCWLDRVLPILFLLSLAIVSFVGGAGIVEFNTDFYQRTLNPPFRGLKVLNEQRRLDRDWTKYARFPVRNEQTGTTIYDKARTYDGYTMCVSYGRSTSAELISMTGDVVHRWHLPFREAWPTSPQVPSPAPEERLNWHTARLLPNGDLIAVYVSVASAPHGYGLAKINKDSKLVWRYSENAHHDFDVDESGQVYTLQHSTTREQVKGAPHLQAPLLRDSVVVLSSSGKEVKRVDVFDAFAKSPAFRQYLASIPSDERMGDHTHANTIALIPEAFADKHGFCQAGDLMISLRNPGMLAILNLEREEIVWAARGIWKRQHDCDPLENGNILLFDNRGRYGPGGNSRILEWNPANGAIEWCYCGTEESPFESLSRGCQQLLPNGNVLITEANNGRLLEVTRDRQVVWEFNNPHRFGENNEYVAAVCSGQRIAADELTFLKAASIASSKASAGKTTADKRK